MNCKVCENTSAKNSAVSFFRFPKENSRCKDWAERCHLTNSHDKYGTLQFYKSFRICSDHFDPKEIVFDGRKKRLLQSAVPRFLITPKPGSNKQQQQDDDVLRTQHKFKAVENFCRLCAEETGNLTDIFGTRGKTLNLENKLKYLPMVVDKCDILPLKVCHRCVSKVNQFCDFIVSCLKAETKLKVMLNMTDCNENLEVVKSSDELTNNIIQDTVTEVPNLNIMSSIRDHDDVTEFRENNLQTGTTLCNCDVKTFTTSNAVDLQFATDVHKNIFGTSNLNSSSRQLKLNSGTNSDEKSLKYQICLKTFHQPSFLSDRYHVKGIDKTRFFTNIRQFETGEGLYDICLISSASTPEQINNKKRGLKIHARKHNQFDNFSKITVKSKTTARIQCQDCDKSFKSRKACQIHESTHSVAIPWQCKQCGKIFRSKSSFRQHRSVHSEERLFSCQVCGMRFKRKDTLGNHFRIHTGERPFVCKVCGFAFKQRGDCLKHEKNHVKTSQAETLSSNTTKPDTNLKSETPNLESFTIKSAGTISWTNDKSSGMSVTEMVPV